MPPPLLFSSSKEGETMNFLDLEGLKTFKRNCDDLYEKKSFITNKSDVVDVDFSKNQNKSFITMCRSSETGNSTKKDGHIINLAWDNSAWGSQIFIQDGTTPTMMARTVLSISPIKYSSWDTLCSSSNYSSVIPAISEDTIKSMF